MSDFDLPTVTPIQPMLGRRVVIEAHDTGLRRHGTVEQVSEGGRMLVEIENAAHGMASHVVILPETRASIDGRYQLLEVL
jgi:hypothetical protein